MLSKSSSCLQPGSQTRACSACGTVAATERDSSFAGVRDANHGIFRPINPFCFVCSCDVASCSKSGRVVILLNGRFAGRKAVVVKAFDDGHKDRKFGVALVVGLERAPRKTTKAMSDKKVEKRQRVKPFVKYVNYNHIMPTRYTVAIADALSKDVADDLLEDADKKKEQLNKIKGALQARYKKLESTSEKDHTGALYLFRKLKF